MPTRLAPVWDPFVEVPVRAIVSLAREPRAKCSNCKVRRVLYRIHVIVGPYGDKTEARCAPCWGIR